MATVTALTAARMLAIEAASVVSGVVTGGNLILTRKDGSTINAGAVKGDKGDVGPTGPPGIQPPTGSWTGWLTDTPPSGYLLMNGQEVSRTEYADLFAVIGTVGGDGDGSSTFNIPNWTELVPRGASIDEPVGTIAGSDEVTLLPDNVPPHVHSINHNHANASVPMQYGSDVPTTGSGVRIFRINGQGAGGSSGTNGPFAVNIPAYSGNSGTNATTNDPIDITPRHAASYFIIKT